MTAPDDPFELPGTVHVGRVAHRVGALDQVVPFYRDVVGLRVERDGPHALLGAGDRTLLELVEAPDAPERPRAAAGLFHVAFRVPERAALGDALRRIQGSSASLTGASDHLASEALYLADPGGNGVEIYRDRPRREWVRTPEGGVELDTLPLDLEGLATAGNGEAADRLPRGSDVGHVHLEVSDLPRAEAFYREGLGLGLRYRSGDQAAFLAAGDYHHHVGLNTWNGRSEPASGSRGLAWFELVLPDERTLATVRDRLTERGHGADERAGAAAVTDPDGIELRLSVA